MALVPSRCVRPSNRMSALHPARHKLPKPTMTGLPIGGQHCSGAIYGGRKQRSYASPERGPNALCTSGAQCTDSQPAAALDAPSAISRRSVTITVSKYSGNLRPSAISISWKPIIPIVASWAASSASKVRVPSAPSARCGQAGFRLARCPVIAKAELRADIRFGSEVP